jgi:hypothetical protein
MKDLPSPRVRTNWHLFVQMQQLIEGGTNPHAAAVDIATKHWRGVSESYDACVWWLQDNYRKYQDVATESVREAEREAERQDKIETAHFHKWFKKDPKRAIESVVEKMLRKRDDDRGIFLSKRR